MIGRELDPDTVLVHSGHFALVLKRENTLPTNRIREEIRIETFLDWRQNDMISSKPIFIFFILYS